MDFLTQMAERSRERVQAASRLSAFEEVVSRAKDTPRPPRLKLRGTGFDLIAEIKLRSPAVGELKGQEENIESRAAAYAHAGAAAVSVLTEPSRFDGSLEHLEAAAGALKSAGVPAMRKDFLVDRYQVAEARAAGAGGVLLIVRMLPRGQLEELMNAARELELFALLEAFDERDIEFTHELARGEGVLVGVNCRDLSTLQVVPGRLATLAPLLPRNVPRVAESGVTTAADAREASRAGYDLALVGSALMQARSPDVLARQMLEAGAKR